MQELAFDHSDRQTPGIVRRWLAPICTSAGMKGSTSALVVATELTTNAILHGDGATRVRATTERGVFRIEVVDRSPAAPVRRRPAADDLGGRGLLLVKALSDRWGSVFTPGGKVVWAEFDLGSGH